MNSDIFFPMEAKVREKNTGLCLIRILAAFLVVCFHFHSNRDHYPRPYIFLRELAVSMFLIMSFYLGKKTIFSTDTAGQKKKLKRQLVPYLFWGAAAWCYMFIAGNLLNLTEHVTPGNLIWQILTGCVENVDPPLWYLWQSMALMLLFILIYRIFKEKATVVILLSLVVICYILQYTGINFNFFSGQRYEIKNMLATKIAVTIYGASDDIIITVMLGVGTNGIVSNYRMISSKLQELLLSAFNSLQASIGNLVYDRESDRGIPFFKAFDLSGFFLALVSASGVMCLCQELVVLWLHNTDLLLPYSFVAALSLNLFIAIQNNPMTYFRNSLGHFETDRNYMIAAALINVILSIILGLSIGLTGIMIATVIGHLFIYLGRCVVVHKYFLRERLTGYCLSVLFRIGLLAVSVIITMYIGDLIRPHINSGIVFFLIKGIISVAVSVCIFLIVYSRSESFKTILQYAHTARDILKNRRSKGVTKE